MRTLICFALLTTISYADIYSTGPDGIDSQPVANLGYTGDGIKIGEVDGARVGLPTYDDQSLCNVFVVPADIFHQGSSAIPNQNIDAGSGMISFNANHATQVAGIMVSQEPNEFGSGSGGIAPGAWLYSAGFDSDQPGVVAVTINNLALFDCRTINLSFGFNTAPQSALISDFVDWSAAAQNVLYVVAQDEGTGAVPERKGNFPVPGDNYNGMTVAALIPDTSGVWNTVAKNMRQYDTRDGALCLAAPGSNIVVTELWDTQETWQGSFPGVGASSFAAPHVTGTVALLQDVFRNSYDTRQHNVMKSVLMTSADVLTGVLGSGKTITNYAGDNWTDLAVNRAGLNDYFGAGALNASRAYELLAGGEHGPGVVNSSVGWDFGTVVTNGTNKYQFPGFAIDAGSWVDITLCWDTLTSLVSVDGNNSFTNPDDTITLVGVPALTLMLKQGGATIESLSVGNGNSTEHIFREIPAGSYEIWVLQAGGVEISYGLSWIFGPGNGIAGDFNNDNVVNIADYNTWKNNYGPYSAADYTTWRDHTTSLAVATVPEPTTLVLMLIGISVAAWQREYGMKP